MLAITYFWNVGNGSLFAAMLKGLILFAILAGLVLLTAWLGTAVFAAFGAALGKTAAIGAGAWAMAKLPALTGMLL